MQPCGKYIGNLLSPHQGEFAREVSEPIHHPSYAGIAGHIRVLTPIQTRELLDWCEYESIDVHSVSILPFPDGVSRILEKYVKDRGHFLHFTAKKPLQ